MHAAIAQHHASIAVICQRYGISRLEGFGSAARADDFNPASSDADFLVEFEPGVQPGLDTFFGAKAALEALLGRGVDLVWSPTQCATLTCWPTSTAAASQSMQRDPRAFLWDVRESALAIQSFTTGMDLDAYAANAMAQAAVEPVLLGGRLGAIFYIADCA